MPVVTSHWLVSLPWVANVPNQNNVALKGEQF
jgi:hypothetical protein